MNSHWFLRFADRYLLDDRPLGRFVLKRLRWFSAGGFYAVLILFPLFCAYSWLRRAIRSALGRKPNVLWAPTPIINIAEQSNILRNAGYNSDTLVFTTYFITKDFSYSFERLTGSPVTSTWFTNVLFLWSLTKYDVYQFFYDGGVWSGMKIVPHAKWLELPLLRLAGKQIIVMAYGGDVRTLARNNHWQPFNICHECPDPTKNCICSDKQAAKNTKYHRDWCADMIAMGDMYDFVYGSRPDFLHWPINTETLPEAPPTRDINGRNGQIVIAHSPNHRHFKGTRFLEAAAEELRAKGYDVALDIIERVPNVEAKRRYAAADIIFAQCLAGWIGYTEVEGMALGKPVVTFIRDQQRYLGHVDDWPPGNATPANLGEVLEGLITNPDKRRDLGERGRRHAEKYWGTQSSQDRYDALIMKAWTGKSLWRDLKRKSADLHCGEERARLGEPSAAKPIALGEFPVWTDPEEFLGRLDWGQFGRPSIDETGIPVAHHKGEIYHFAGLASQYALSLYHQSLAGIVNSSAQQKFLGVAHWLAGEAENDSVFEAPELETFQTYQEASARLLAQRGLALSVMMRAHAMAGDDVYLEAVKTLVTRLTPPPSGSTAVTELLDDGCRGDGMADIPILVTNALATSELAKMQQEVRVAPVDLWSRIEKTALEASYRLVSVDLDFAARERAFGYAGCFDDIYFSATGLLALGREINDATLNQRGKSVLRGIRSARWRAFRSFQAPL